MELVQPPAVKQTLIFGLAMRLLRRDLWMLLAAVIVKECGCGLSPKVIRRLNGVGMFVPSMWAVSGYELSELKRVSIGTRSQYGPIDDQILTAAATLGAATIDGLHIVASGASTMDVRRAC